jgi:branched-chain amino acid transport system ATP-binding protein
VVSLIGRNGAGKTSILKAIMGLMPRVKGAIGYDGTQIVGKRPDQIARLGLALCPEERAIFSTLSVEENLMLPPAIAAAEYSVDQIYELFPNLRRRGKAGGTTLSGGEQQMLAIARILRTGAKTLLLDEPSEGLAPVIVQQIGRTIRTIKERGFTILLVEQNLKFSRTISDRYYVVERGLIVDSFLAADLDRDPEKIKQYLAV